MTENREKHVISVLLAKRAELAGDVLSHEKRLADVKTALLHLDATILLFDPTQTPNLIQPRQRRPKVSNSWFRPGECLRAIRDALREAGQPLTTRQIADSIMVRHKKRGEGGHDPELLFRAIESALWRRSADIVVADPTEKPRRWKVKSE